MKKQSKTVKVRFLKENYGGGRQGGGAQMAHMGDDLRVDGDVTPASDQATEHPGQPVLPSPRARIGQVEDYNQVYAMLSGRPQMATNSALKDIMVELEVGDPESCAQAVADYLHDRAKIS